MKRITADDIFTMSESTTAARVEITKRSFIHFFAYYFRHYLTHNFSDFHYDMADDLMGLARGYLSEAAEITYRGSSKTSLAKAFITWCICLKEYQYINVDAYDGSNSERFLFDVVLELQTNELIKSDFGELFNVKRDQSKITQKRVKDFLTTNGIRVEAHTTQEPVRGRLHRNIRPQLLILDDFEVRKTLDSEAATRQVREHIIEAKAGMDPMRCSILWLGNYISEFGNVHFLMERLKDNSRARVRLVPLIDTEGNITWPQRFVMTDEEAKAQGRASIEKLRRDMWNPDTGDAEFNREMLCDPRANASKVFRRDMFLPVTMADIRRLKIRTYFTVDPGGSGDDDDMTDKDPAGFCINWVAPDGFWNVKAWGEKCGPTVLITRIIDTLKWLEDTGTPCHLFAWEKNQYTNALKPQLYEEMRRRNSLKPVMEIVNTRKKEDRIKGALLHRYESGQIRHLEGECRELEDQLVMFPDGAHDDIADAESFMAQVVMPPLSGVRVNESPISKLL